MRAFLKRSTPRMSQQAREDQLQRKAVVLEYFTRRKRKERKRKSRGLSARQRRALRLFDIKPEQQRYARPVLLPARRQHPPVWMWVGGAAPASATRGQPTLTNADCWVGLLTASLAGLTGVCASIGF